MDASRIRTRSSRSSTRALAWMRQVLRRRIAERSVSKVIESSMVCGTSCSSGSLLVLKSYKGVDNGLDVSGRSQHTHLRDVYIDCLQIVGVGQDIVFTSTSTFQCDIKILDPSLI